MNPSVVVVLLHFPLGCQGQPEVSLVVYVLVCFPRQRILPALSRMGDERKGMRLHSYILLCVESLHMVHVVVYKLSPNVVYHVCGLLHVAVSVLLVLIRLYIFSGMM